MNRDEPIAVNAAFDVAHEDDDILVVSKAAPLLMHPVGTKAEPTLWHGVRELLAYELACGGQVSLINRLDRETSGLVLIAKNARAAHELGCAMQQRRIRKRYLAIVHGLPAWHTACCAEPLRRMCEVADTPVRVRQLCHPSGRPCRTGFRVLRRVLARDGLPPMCLLECFPHTGRMHQIRAHLAYLGHPIVGDKIYRDETCYLRFIEHGWTTELARELILPRHALHASGLILPTSHGELHIHSPLPADMLRLLPDDFCEVSLADAVTQDFSV